MKKGLLFLLFTVIGFSSFAQFLVSSDTVYISGFPKTDISAHKADTIYNTSNMDSLHLTWYKVSDNLLPGWSGIGICDWENCYQFDGSAHTASLAPGAKNIIYVDMKAAPTASDGCSYATLRLTQSGGAMTTKDIVYKYCTWATAVKEVDAANFVTIYPNPASSFVNISINNDKITNVNILNVVGRKVARFDVSANTPNPIRISLDNVADGMYLLQFTDANGKQLGVRRVTKR